MSDPYGSDLVIDLPTSLSCSILSDWVSTVDLARLNSAYCCHAKRGVVLDMLGSAEFLSKYDLRTYEIYRVSKEYWDWILRRDIKLFHITAGSSRADTEKLESYAKRHERCIGHLDLAAVESSSFSMHCKHLIALTCDINVNPAFETVLRNNPSLQMLDLHGLEEVDIESFKTIHLPQLTQLRLDVDERSAQLVAAASRMPERLLKLELLYINTDLSGVAQHCPHLRSLSISVQYDGFEEGTGFDLIEFTSHLSRLANLQLVDIIDLDDAKLLAVVLNLKQLRYLNLKFCGSYCVLSYAGIEHIAEHCATTLEVFGLQLYYETTEITSVSLNLLHARCTKLRQLHVEAPLGYQGILLGSVTTLLVEDTCSDGILVRISDLYPQLEVLELDNGTTACTLPTLRELCLKCPKLRRIHVKRDSIACVYMKSLVATLPQLLVTDIFDDRRLDAMNMPI